MAELMCVAATMNPDWEGLHRHFNQLANKIENPGFKRRPKGKRMSQQQKILQILQQGKTLTRLKAMHYGIMNITARVSELRKAGYDIRCIMQKDIDGREYGEFYLEDAG